MAEIFPEWVNDVPRYVVIAAGVSLVAGGLAVWYFFSPEYTDVGYKPRQPIPYSHELHAGELGIDCRYCHASVETSAAASLPPTQTCMNCHALVARDSPSVAALLRSADTGEPIRWIRVHKTPDYAYFNHSVHVRKGIGCASCHGDVTEMEEIELVEPLSMRWCLDCHRNPDPHFRPLDQITTPKWARVSDPATFAETFKRDHRIAPSTECSACHH